MIFFFIYHLSFVQNKQFYSSCAYHWDLRSTRYYANTELIEMITEKNLSNR